MSFCRCLVSSFARRILQQQQGHFVFHHADSRARNTTYRSIQTYASHVTESHLPPTPLTWA